MINDLAVTINQHPVALGIIPDAHCEVDIPRGRSIKATQITDPIKHLDKSTESSSNAQSTGTSSTKKGQKQTFKVHRWCGHQELRPLISELQVLPGPKRTGEIRGVFILEHNSIKAILQSAEGLTEAFDNCIFVTVRKNPQMVHA